MRKIKPILQLTRTECGICCLAMLTSYYGFKKPIRYFRENMDTGRDGVSVSIISNMLNKIGFDFSYYRLSEIDLENNAFLPAIVHTKKNHFLLVEGYEKKTKTVKIIDPSCGKIKISLKELIDLSNDFILYASPNEHFKPEKEKESVWKPLHFLIKEVSVKFIGSLILSICTYFFTLAIPLLIQTFIDRFNNEQNIQFSNLDISTAVLSVILFLIVSFFRNKVVVASEVIIDKSLLLKLMNHILRLPYKYFETRTTGEILFRINLLNSIRLLISEGLIRGIIDIGSMIFIIMYMALIVPELIVGIFIMLIFIFIIANTINNRVIIFNKEELTEQAHISSIETETIEMMFDIKCLGVEGLFEDRLKYQYEKFQRQFKKREMLSRCNVSLLQFFQLFLPFILLLINISLIERTGLSLGMVVAFYTLSNMLITNCIALVQEVTNFRLMKNYILRINDILYEKQDTQEDSKIITTFENLNVNELSFSYSKNSNNLLNNINLSIKKGQKIAIVGGSGEGKSTLVKLLLGLYRGTSGTITYNGINIEKLDQNNLKKIVGIMPQDAKLFNGSIKYNITLGDERITDETVKTALKKANIYNDVMKMPLKENTILSAGGGNLSGGQRQRIALARILVSNPQLLILDEATSSLDGINEKEIMNVLKECDCTQIIVSHRFSTILQADYVYLIKDGMIAEEGTIRSLIDKSGIFMELFGKQIEVFNSREEEGIQ